MKKLASPELRDAHLPKFIYDEAIGSVVERVRPLPEVTLPLLASRGRVLAAPVYARWGNAPVLAALGLSAMAPVLAFSTARVIGSLPSPW